MKHTKLTILFLLFLCIQVSAQNPEHWENLVDANDPWNYIIPASELPDSWTNTDFDDSSWLTGPGGIGYGDSDDKTIVPDGTMSVFMRKTFSVSNSSELISAFLFVDYDDAFVAYLNGIEIARANIGTKGIRPAFNQPADKIIEPAAASGMTPITFPIDNQILSSALKAGDNVLALQIHNQAVSSSDLSSTTYFIAGFSNQSSGFRLPPYWFSTSLSGISNLPLIVIDTWGGAILSEPKIDAWIKVIDNGEGLENNINDTATDFEGYIGIEIRGQSSQMFPKKGYGFETRNPLKEDSSVSLLGMPAESDWILSAPYSDKTMMRNPLTFYLGNKMDPWQPGTKWCELYLNGDYKGVYLLVEKIKRDKKRVNISKLLPEDITGDSLTGGYILKIDKINDLAADQHFLTYPIKYPNTRNYDYSYVYPKWDEIVPEQKNYIKDYLTSFETALNTSNFKDPATGFRKYIDVNSFIDFQIIQELTNNVDGYRYSTFFYKQKDSQGGKLYAGPLWDFDLCYGNVDYAPNNLATNKWLYTTYGPGEGSCMHWWARLMQDPDYKALLRYRYTLLRSSVLNTDSVFKFLDINQSHLGNAIERNYQRWPILDQYIWPNSEVRNSYENEMDFLKTWISDRLTWLDTQWLFPLSNISIISTQKNFQVYPDPFNEYFNLIFTPLNADPVIMDLYNLQGQKVFSRKIDIQNTSEVNLEIRNIEIPDGIYLLRVNQSGCLVLCTKILRISNIN